MRKIIRLTVVELSSDSCFFFV